MCNWHTRIRDAPACAFLTPEGPKKTTLIGGSGVAFASVTVWLQFQEIL
jgi:hypothetical protein